jgi:hypothetical protein
MTCSRSWSCRREPLVPLYCAHHAYACIRLAQIQQSSALHQQVHAWAASNLDHGGCCIVRSNPPQTAEATPMQTSSMHAYQGNDAGDDYTYVSPPIDLVAATASGATAAAPQSAFEQVPVGRDAGNHGNDAVALRAEAVNAPQQVSIPIARSPSSSRNGHNAIVLEGHHIQE